MNNLNVLNKLQEKNNLLKSKLTHEQLKHDNYSFQYFKKHSLLIINDYKQTKSLTKSALNLNISPIEVLKWYTQGQLKNPEFRAFYLAINELNSNEKTEPEASKPKNNQVNTSDESTAPDGEYIISQYGDGWSYKTYVNGEKIFIISDELENLKKKVKSKNLPLD